MRAVRSEAFEFAARRLVVGVELSDDGPEARAVVHFAQMREFVGDDVIDDLAREMDQPPVEADSAAQAATAPARSRRRQRERRGGQR